MSNKKTKSLEEYVKDQGLNIEDLSEEEKEMQTNALAAYNKKTALETVYQDSLNKLNTSKKNQSKEAYFQNEKLMKYLPQNMKAQGLGGLGVSQQAYIDAANNYQNNLASINADYNTQKTTLDTTKAENDMAIENELSSANQITKEKFWQKKYQEEMNGLRAQLETTLQEKLSGLDSNQNGKITEEQKAKALEAYNEILKNNDLTNETKNYLKSIIDTVQVETKEEMFADATKGKGVIPFNGKNYKITKELSSNANEISRNNDFKAQLKEKFGTTNPYDSKIPNGTTFEIKCDNKGANDFNFWDDVGAFLLSPFGHGAWDSWASSNTRCVTYINGKWYLSEKV